MYRTYQSLAISLILAFHSSYVLGNQLISRIDPCDLMMHGRDISGEDKYTYIPDFPLSRENHQLPVEFYLNKSIPPLYKPAAHAAALEWNIEAGFELITISREIDDSDYNERNNEGCMNEDNDGKNTQKQGCKNVIYWLDNDQYDSFTSERGMTVSTAAVTDFQMISLDFAKPYVTIHDTDIFMHAGRNSAIEVTRQLFTQHLNRMDVEYPKDMDIADLQVLFIKTLLDMSSDDFYSMVLKLMRDKKVIIPIAGREERKRWLIEKINEEMEDTQSLISFEDFRDLIIIEYALDLTTLPYDSNLFKSHLLYEFGHALGLRGHDNEPGSLPITPVPRFPRDLTVPWHIDNLALHGLSCSYYLEGLR